MGKQEKKLGQLYRRDMRAQVQAMAELHFKDGPVFKGKPKWCPLWLWNKTVMFVCDDLFIIRYQQYLRSHPKAAEEANAIFKGEKPNDSTEENTA